MAATEVFAKYEELCPWHHREPFADGVQEPIVLRPDDSYFVSWAPAPGNSTPGWITVSTPRVNAGVFLVQPGGWFDSGNHPGPEPYYIIKGTLHLSNPDTGDVIEVSAGEASNIPAFAYHHAHNFGDEACWIQWWVPGGAGGGVGTPGVRRAPWRTRRARVRLPSPGSCGARSAAGTPYRRPGP